MGWDEKETGSGEGKMVKKKGNYIGTLCRIDWIIERITFYISWISVACIVVMAFLAVIDVILAKTVGSGIAVQKEIIEECMVPVFVLFVGNVQMTEGLMSVDIISKHYNRTLKRIQGTVTSILGTAIMSFAGWRIFILFQDYLRKQTRASQMMTSIKVWPFALCLSIGLFILALTFLWTLVRVNFMTDQELAQRAPFYEKDGEEGSDGGES